MRSEIRTAFAVLATAAVLLGSATMAIAADEDAGTPDPTASSSSPSPSPSSSEPTDPEPSVSTPTPDPTETTPPVPTGAFTVDDAQVRWGVNDESNNLSFAPGRVNLLSAGKIPDLGPAGTLTQSGWKQADGNVSIQKYLKEAWTPATWAGLRTTSSGAPMSGTAGPFSNHEVVISGGSGTVDPTTASATIRWTGSFSVVYYSGYSFFYVSDPQLTVAGGIGTLTGTLSGYSSSMEDLTKWEAVAPVPGVVLANLGTVDLTADLGFTATPAYAKVPVSIPANGVEQVRSGAAWGSFPQSFVDYQLKSGSGAYWYSSGGSADAHKAASPVTVSYAAGSPVRVKAPVTKTTKKPKVTNEAPEAPDSAGTPPTTTATTPSSPLPLAAPASGTDVRAGSTLTQFRPASTVVGAVAAPDDASPTGLWVLGGVLLATASLLALSPFAYSAIRKAG